MKILGIQGSPRIGGNTDILLDKALSGASSKGAYVEKIILNKLKFSPCLECENTKNDGTCIVNDEMQIIYKKIKEVDALILASPIFFGSVSAQVKMMVDRFQCPWRAKYIYKNDVFGKKKIGGFICVSAGGKNDFFNNAKSIVKNLFVTINVSYQEELFCKGVEEKGDIIKHPDFLQKAFELGIKIGGGV
ncbi:MAG: flavodoxin family protein [Candidatus Firestonebacteria bacterium]